MTRGFVLAKNAVANVARGSSAAVVALLLPPFLTRLMSTDAYGAWALVLQISAYVGYLDFGIQTAVGRFVAHADERGDVHQRDQIVSTAFATLGITGLLGLSVVALIATIMPAIFPKLPSNLISQARIALLLVGCSLAIGLPASVFNGVFIGLQRFEIPASVVGISRVVSATLIVLVVRRGGSLISMAIAMAAVNLSSYGLQYWVCRRNVPGLKLHRACISRRSMHELIDYCFSLSIWSFAMLLVSGLDVLLVGRFQFGAVASYSVAATLITFLAGLQNAVFAVMVPATAVQHARGDSRELGQGIITATRYGSFLLLLTGLPLILASRSILTFWVGGVYAEQGARVLQVLVIANMIRLTALPYVMTLIGTGQQRLVTITPILEGVSNLVASVAAGYFLGALGVAVGTLIGSFAGVGGNFLYNMPRTTAVEFRISDYFREGMLRPALCALPVTLAAAVLFRIGLTPALRYAGLVAGLATTGFLVWHWGLVGSEREKLRTWRFVLQS